jgi:DNA-binding response OmpR family regulator
MSFLLVDDEARLRNALAKSLCVRGYRVDDVGTCQEAIEATRQGDYDLIFLDINLPDASGWDLLRSMRESGRSIPTVVFSAVPPNAERVREFRPLGVLTKPFPIDAMLRFVSQVADEDPHE